MVNIYNRCFYPLFGWPFLTQCCESCWVICCRKWHFLHGSSIKFTTPYYAESFKRHISLYGVNEWYHYSLTKLRGLFKNVYELVNLGALKSSLFNKLYISFNIWVKCIVWNFKAYFSNPKSKYLTHTLKDTIFMQYWKFKRSQIYELVCAFNMPPNPLWYYEYITFMLREESS